MTLLPQPANTPGPPTPNHYPTAAYEQVHQVDNKLQATVREPGAALGQMPPQPGAAKARFPTDPPAV